MKQKPESMLYADSARGIYIPQYFAETIRRDCVTGVRDELWTVLEGGPDGPDSADYWEVWQDVCDCASVTVDKTKYFIHLDGDCWLIPEGMVYSDSGEFFVWPEDQEEEREKYALYEKTGDERLRG